MLTLLISMMLWCSLLLQHHVHLLRCPSSHPVTQTLCPLPGKPLRDLCPTWLLPRAVEVIGQLATPATSPVILQACSVDRLIKFMFLEWMATVLDPEVKFAFLKQVRITVIFYNHLQYLMLLKTSQTTLETAWRHLCNHSKHPPF